MTKLKTKTETVYIRVRPEDKQRWQDTATAQNRNLSEWVCIVCNDAASKKQEGSQ